MNCSYFLLVLFSVAVHVGCSGRILDERTWWSVAVRPSDMVQGAELPPVPRMTKTAPSPVMKQSTANSQRRTLPSSPAATPDITPVEVLSQSRQASLETPQAEDFVNAMQIYDYESGRVYQVVTAPGYVTALYLKPGETLRDAAAGDTKRWLVTTATVGADGTVAENDLRWNQNDNKQNHNDPVERVIVLIKPRRPGLETNLLITTDQRVYLIDLRSVAVAAYHSAVAWHYDEDVQLQTETKAHSDAMVSGPSPSTMRNYGYVIKSPADDPPDWLPQRVYDDGRRVHIEFAQQISRMPVLFVVGRDNELQLVNTVSYGDALVVQERFDRAELHYDGHRVLIESMPHYRRNRPFGLLRRWFGEGE